MIRKEYVKLVFDVFMLANKAKHSQEKIYIFVINQYYKMKYEIFSVKLLT